jgi:hypothetical protein
VLLDFHRRRGLAAIKTIEIENDLGNGRDIGGGA